MKKFIHLLIASLFIGAPLPLGALTLAYASITPCNPKVETQSSHGRANVVEVWFKDVGSCEWQVPNGVVELHGVIVGGGGAGAGPNTSGNRGGDGGEVVSFTSNSLGSTLTIEVGSGGTGTRTGGFSGGSGLPSSIDNQGSVEIAQGGAGGVPGSGPGSGWSGTGAGGGAASGNPGVGGAGANGQAYSRFPSYVFGGGGGSGVYYGSAGTFTGGLGGSGGGGNGGSFTSSTGVSATYTVPLAGGINQGGGGGGAPNFAGANAVASGDGGSGVVLLEYSIYTATFDSQGGSSVSSSTIFGGGTLSAPSAPTRANYSFQGWSLTPSGSAVSFPYTPTSDVTLYALWQRTHATVTFDPNGGTGSSTTQVVPVGTPTALSALSFTRASYTFQGWTEASNGSGTVFANEASFTATTDTTLYAQWQSGALAAPTVVPSSTDSLTNATTRTFAFSGVVGATFECTLDGVTTGSCTSPWTVSSLSDGAHSVSIVQEWNGNRSSSVDYNWTVDATAPPVVITSSLPSSSASSHLFTFTGEAGLTFTCDLNGTSTSCSSGFSTGALSDGVHTFAVSQVDAAGNTGVARQSWTKGIISSSSGNSGNTSPPTSIESPATTPPVVPLRRQVTPDLATSSTDAAPTLQVTQPSTPVTPAPQIMEPDPLIGEEGVADEEESEQFDLAQSFGEIFSFDSPLQPVANTAIGASGDDSVIVVFDPQATPEARAATSNLVVASAAIAGVVALAGAAGAASTAALASAPSSFSGGGGGGASLGRGATMNEDSLDALAVADYTDRRSTNRRTGKGDQLRIWRFKWMTWWDKPSRAVTQFLAPISPLVSKLSNDAAYLRSMVGSLSLLVPATAVIVALFALGEGEGVLLHPPVYLYALMMIIGVFDAFAGSLAMSIFVLGSLPLMNVYSIEDWRLLAGIIVSGFGPIIVARSVRDFRRAPERGRGDWIVTLGDVAFASLMGGWVAGLIVRSLPALTGLTVPAANYVISFQVWATFAIGARVLLESVATRGFPGRMNVLSPWVLKEPPPFQKVIAQIGRLGFYIFIASSFMGFGPVVLAAGLMFLAPSILRELSDRLPQSRVLWQIFPTGLAGLAMILGLEIVLEQSLSQWLGDHPDFSIIFIISLLALILTMSILGILGREPAPGARHWTQNPTFRFWRRFGAVSVFIMLFLFTGML